MTTTPLPPPTTVVGNTRVLGDVARGGDEPRRAIGRRRRSDIYAVIGAAVASLSSTSLVFGQFTALSGALGFILVAYVLFLGFYALIVSFDEEGPIVRDRVVSAAVHSLAAVLLVALVFVVSFTFWRGKAAIAHSNFFREDMTHAGPLDPLTVGGITHGAVGTLEEITIALLITVPLGLVCALFLSETRGWFPRLVRTLVDAMTALPSIVAGLFILATWILVLHRPKSGLAAALAISVMMLPIIIRAADVVLRLVPGTLKEASYAVGASHWRTVWHVVLPTARSGLTTAVILGTARGIGETSPVLLTAGYAASLNWNAFNGPMPSLPLLAFQLVKSPQPSYIARGFGAAATLMALVLVLFIAARVIGGRPAGQLSTRQLRKRQLKSDEDSKRMAAQLFVHPPRTSKDTIP